MHEGFPYDKEGFLPGFYQHLKDREVAFLMHLEKTEFIKDKWQILYGSAKMPVYEVDDPWVEIKP